MVGQPPKRVGRKSYILTLDRFKTIEFLYVYGVNLALSHPLLLTLSTFEREGVYPRISVYPPLVPRNRFHVPKPKVNTFDASVPNYIFNIIGSFL